MASNDLEKLRKGARLLTLTVTSYIFLVLGLAILFDTPIVAFVILLVNIGLLTYCLATAQDEKRLALIISLILTLVTFIFALLLVVATLFFPY